MDEVEKNYNNKNNNSDNNTTNYAFLYRIASFSTSKNTTFTRFLFKEFIDKVKI